MSTSREREKVGRFRIEEKIGEGGMGVVYRAKDEKSGEVVAIKLLGDEHIADEGRRKRFLREARVSAALDHPGIARVRDVLEEESTVVIVMDLVRGESVRASLDGHRYTVEESIRITKAIAEAVAYAHAKGVVHRDLKPDNVMLDGESGVRVLDFGLAKLRETSDAMLYEAETETSVTHEGHVLGTPGYMAPEQAAGKQVSFRADVFSLGVMLYEMLAFERPFVGSSAMEIIIAAMRDDPPAPSTKNPKVPPALDELVRACLTKAPENRPSMEDLAEALGAIDPSQTAVAAPVAKPRASFRRLWIGAAIACVVALPSFLAWRSTSAGNASPSPEPSTSTSVATAPAVVPTTMMDLPLPASTAPAAIDAYKAAVAQERDGAEDGALDQYERAIALDPDMAAAHLRIAIRNADFVATIPRTEIALAVRLRDRLSPRDQELLDAQRPAFQRDPPDTDEWRTRMRALADKYPGDAEIAYENAALLDILGAFQEAADWARRAIVLDPKFGLAFMELAQDLAYLGHFPEADATVDRCLTTSPNAEWCMWLREFINGFEGRCSATIASARERIAINPTLPEGYKGLALALAATDQPEAAQREALAQTAARMKDPETRATYELKQGMRFDALAGDFNAALAKVRKRAQVSAKNADMATQASIAHAQAEILLEIGQPEEAARVASTFLDRRFAWAPAPYMHDYSLSEDQTPVLLSIVHQVRKTDDAAYAAAIGTWREKWKSGLHGDYSPFLWVYGYAAVASTKEEATEAMRALPQYSPIPPFIPNGNVPRTYIGRTFLLAGQREQGISYLEQSVGECSAGTRPIGWLHTQSWLADALADRDGPGDRAKACHAYDVVLAHWGNAKPRSVTAEHATVARRALHCGADGG